MWKRESRRQSGSGTMWGGLDCRWALIPSWATSWALSWDSALCSQHSLSGWPWVSLGSRPQPRPLAQVPSSRSIQPVAKWTFLLGHLWAPEANMSSQNYSSLPPSPSSLPSGSCISAKGPTVYPAPFKPRLSTVIGSGACLKITTHLWNLASGLAGGSEG